MKAINKIFSLWHCCLLLLPLVAGSCQEAITTDRDPAPEPLPGNGSARFSVRAGEGESVPPNIGFYVQYAGDKGVQYNVAGKYNEKDKRWEATSDWISDSPADVVVYGPYDAEQSPTKPALTLKAALYGDGKADIVSGKTTIASGHQEIAVTLSHVYTRLQFSLCKAVGDNSPETVITKIEMRGGDIYKVVEYNPFTGAYDVPKQETPEKPIVSLVVDPPLTVLALPAQATLDLLLIPVRQSFTEDAYLWLYTEGGEHPMKVRIPQNTFTDDNPFAPGKQYTANIRLSPTETSITNVTVSKWEDVDKGTVDTE